MFDCELRQHRSISGPSPPASQNPNGRYLDYEEEASLPQLDAFPHPADQTAAALTGGTPSAAATTPTPAVTLAIASGTAASALEAGAESGLPLVLGEDRGDDKGRPTTRLGRVVAGWVSLLPDAARSWGRFEQFLEFIEGVGNMGDRERDLLLNRRMVCRLSSFLLQVRLQTRSLLFVGWLVGRQELELIGANE